MIRFLANGETIWCEDAICPWCGKPGKHPPKFSLEKAFEGPRTFLVYGPAECEGKHEWWVKYQRGRKS